MEFSTPVTTDHAGSSRYSAQDIYDLPEDYMTGVLDYPGDTDYYGFYSWDSGPVTIWVESSNSPYLQIRVHDSSGVLIASDTSSEYASVTVSLEIDRQYYIAITSPNYNSYDYEFVYIFGPSYI